MRLHHRTRATHRAVAVASLLVLAQPSPAPVEAHETALSQTATLTLVFQAATPDDAAARDEYEAIWQAEGAQIVAAMRNYTGLDFEESENIVHVIVVEEASSSGFGDRPMRIRSSYPSDTKRATLIHELGHRLHGRFFYRGDEDHPTLFLYIYDIWVDLYGQEFADAQVTVESRRRGLYDYEGAWRDALALSKEQRATRLQDELASRIRS